MWCLAHRLELAVKDALKGTTFDVVDDMLLRLDYIYEKSPKKCRELEEVITDLKGCITFDDSGIRPVRASGSRWISHKLNAMKRVLSKYGAYTSHIIALSEDHALKSADRAKLQGYCKKWSDAKYILGCAVFTDLLTPASIFSKQMQLDELDILTALSNLLHTVKEVEKLSLMPLPQWPAYSTTLKKVIDENGAKVYQGQELKRFHQAEAFYMNHYEEYCKNLTECLRSRMAWSDTELIRDIIHVLATQGWEKMVREKTPLDSVDRLGESFAVALKGAQADLSKIKAEFEILVSYAVQFISLSTLDYRAVWWRIFHAPSAGEWSNALVLIELLFSLPSSNGKLERAFSLMKVIKTDKRSVLSNESLDDLLMVSISGPPLKEFCPDAAIDLWWKDKLCRPHQQGRKAYASREKSTEGDTAEVEGVTVEEMDMLTNWDDWMAPLPSDIHADSD